ncbi:MAG: hypothetical protein RLZZ387_2758 [Chloroflexota bacterium]
MIYRILCNAGHAPRGRDDGSVEYIPASPLAGAFVAGVGGFDLTMPRVTNSRARFYFTDAGWEQVGKGVAANARREGRVVKVIRRKNPHPSQIVYRDALQVAIVPLKE